MEGDYRLNAIKRKPKNKLNYFITLPNAVSNSGVNMMTNPLEDDIDELPPFDYPELNTNILWVLIIPALLCFGFFSTMCYKGYKKYKNKDNIQYNTTENVRENKLINDYNQRQNDEISDDSEDDEKLRRKTSDDTVESTSDEDDKTDILEVKPRNGGQHISMNRRNRPKKKHKINVNIKDNYNYNYEDMDSNSKQLFDLYEKKNDKRKKSC